MRLQGYSLQPSTWRAPRPVLETLDTHITTLSELSRTLGSSLPLPDPQTPTHRSFVHPDQPNNFIYSLPPCLAGFIDQWEQEPLVLPSNEQAQRTAHRSLVRTWADHELTETLQVHAPNLFDHVIAYCGYTHKSQTLIHAQMAMHVFGHQLLLGPGALTSVLRVLSPLPSHLIPGIVAPIRTHDLQQRDASDLNKQSYLAQPRFLRHVYDETCAWSHLVLSVNNSEHSRIIDERLTSFIEALYHLRVSQFQAASSLTTSTNYKNHPVHYKDKLLGIPSHIHQLKDRILCVQSQYNQLQPFLTNSGMAQNVLQEMDVALVEDLVSQLETQGERAMQDCFEDQRTSAKQWHRLAKTIGSTGSLLPTTPYRI